MARIGLGEKIYDLRKKIQNIESELHELDTPTQDIPELILSTNLLRSNEHLNKVNAKQVELLSEYSKYSSALEETLTLMLEIQMDLKNLLKEQTQLITESKTTRTSKIKSKSQRKTKN